MFNTSLAQGEFPKQFKCAIIRPLLKKRNLDVNILKHYRPVSNLHFASKILEKLVAVRLEEHMLDNNLNDPMQSAYKTSHSTETALLKVTNDILSSLDKRECIVLASLDLSAAFDTVDHTIFIDRLQHLYNINGTALQWFRSYLKQRSQQVCINDKLSMPHGLISGVPQGSVLGARLFTMYIYPLSHIMTSHNVTYHCYADDIQVYTQCKNTDNDITQATKQLEHCINDICSWMTENALKLNENKTEYTIYRSSNTISSDHVLHIGSDTVEQTDRIKILGVTLDNKMNMDQHITNTCRAVNIQIRKINSIRRYLSEDAVKALIQSNAIMRLDYCNSVCIGLPMRSIKRLQLVHNSAARVITRTSRYTSITPALISLHWLPVSKRCQFKILVLTYKALMNNAPHYVCNMLKWYTPNRDLRSAATTSLVPGKHRTIKLGRRLFDTSAALLWNMLPANMKKAETIYEFKKSLKTLLFHN